MPPPSVFLSFSMKHKALVDLFRGQARNNRSGLMFRDYSIKEPVEGAWKIQVERLIRDSNVTICLLGTTTWQSEPVNWEIRKSVGLGKRVLAVYLQPDTVQIPAALSEIGVAPMPWDINAIVGALHEQR